MHTFHRGRYYQFTICECNEAYFTIHFWRLSLSAVSETL